MAVQCTVEPFSREEPLIRLITFFLGLAILAACSDRDIPPGLTEALTVPEDASPTRVLVVTATHGFRHTGAIDTAKALFPELAETTEFDFTVTESVEDLQSLDGFDVLFFANSTLRLATDVEGGLNASQQEAVLEFITAGGGFVGAHSALDACYGWNAYRELVGGGLFHSHPWNQNVGIINETPAHPTTAHLGERFELRDEIYLLDENPRPNVNVLLSLDATSVDLSKLPTEIDRSDIPLSWTSTLGEGKIFMTKLGHFPDVWLDPAYLEHLLQGLRFAAGHSTQDTSGATDS